MATRSKKSPATSSSPPKTKSEPKSAPANISAEAALSFLRDTKSVVSWTVRELAETLQIPRTEAEPILALLEAQGYIARSNKSEWMTTAAGEAVSAAKAPRFSRDTVETAIADLKNRISDANKDRGTPYRITAAVAVGDFLLKDRSKVQAADVGIRLEPREQATELRSATDAKRERAFLKQLRGKAQMLNLRPFAEWMSRRTHRNLL
jgi:hypothetical protein